MTAIHEYRTVDKSAWGYGDWQDEPDKVQWVDEATGLDCLIVRGPSGALCGYVGVTEGHPFFGIAYGACPLPEPCAACKGTRRVECSECDGEGETECTCSRCDHEHEAPCDACDGSGYVDCDCQGLADSRIDPFLLDTVPFDRRLVARWIRHLPDGEAQAVLVEREGWSQRPCALVGDGWILLLMPVSQDAREDMPRFTLDITGAPAGAGRGARG